MKDIFLANQRKKNHQRHFGAAISANMTQPKKWEFCTADQEESAGCAKNVKNILLAVLFYEINTRNVCFNPLQGHMQAYETTNCIGEVCDLESIVKTVKVIIIIFLKLKKCINIMYMIAKKRKCLPPFLYYLYNS